MIEYSGMRWGIFFMAEYGNAFALSALFVLLFLSGWRGPGPEWLGIVWFMLKTYLLILVLFWMRATLPRLRIDQLMGFAWEVLLPFAFLNLFFVGVVQLYGWPLWSLSLLSLAGLLGLGYVVERGQVSWRRSPSPA
jgi:NADH-quinone oxidoreductase subunit H